MRSGAANGADAAFEKGADETEIYLPWEGFNNHRTGIIAPTLDNYAMAREVASYIHPAWNSCNETSRKFHARNMYQVLGMDLATPSDFLICWTADGANGTSRSTSIVTGGTASAINLAIRNDVPVFNIANDDEFHSVLNISGIGSLDALTELINEHRSNGCLV